MKRDDGGFSLLETLVALVILSLAVVVIAGGMSSSVLASNRHREQAAGNALLIQAAERIRSDETLHVRCAVPADYQAAAADVDDLPPGWQILVESVRYYDGIGFTTGCLDLIPDPDDPPILFPLQLQEVTLEVRSSGGRNVERLTFVKGCGDGGRAPECDRS